MSFLRKVLPYFLSLVVTFLVAEGALRLAGARFASSFYIMDPDLGWTLRPNAEGDVTEENIVHIKINSAGMRDDREYSLAKPADVYRVAILGDSFAESMQVPLEKTFVKLLERQLAECKKTKVEILNFGVQGYGTAQELLVWRQKASQYKPDAVVLLFYTGNDLYNNQRVLNPTNADAAPYFVLNGSTLNFQPALAEPSTLRELWAGFVRYSKVGQLLTDAFYKLRRQKVREQEDANRKQFGENYMDRLIYSPPTHDAMREAWAVTEALLPMLRDEVIKTGARFHMALASSSLQVHPDEEIRRNFLSTVNGTDLYYAEHRLAEAAKKQGIDVSIIGEKMISENSSKTIFHGFPGNLGKGHWNEAGHYFVARHFALTLCAQ